MPQKRERVMSCEWISNRCRASTAAFLLFFAASVGALAIPSRASAQVMVCQTRTFWCSFPGSAPSNLPCYCNAPYGIVNGFSINPSQVMKPQRQRRTDPNPPPEQEQEEVDISDESKDCLNGLGNCSGSFRSAVRPRR